MPKPHLTKVDRVAMETHGIIADEEGSCPVRVALTPYICSRCDNVHLNIEIMDSGVVMNISLTQLNAEALADKLCNPS